MKTITFFSYKGGAGRSTLAYNTIPILAGEYYKPTAEEPIIVVDMDIDSCGMSYLLRAETRITEKTNVQALLSNGCDRTRVRRIKDHPFLKDLIPVGNAYGYDDNEAILLLPAKDGKLINENSGSNYNDDKCLVRFETFLDMCESLDVPLVVIDSAVGNTLTANISNEVSNIIVCCMRPTTQFVNGTKRYLCSLEAIVYEPGTEVDSKSLSQQKDIIIVPNVVPQDRIVINDLQYPDYTINRVRTEFNKAFGGDSQKHKYHFDLINGDEFGIPALGRFMWREDRLYKQSNLTEAEQKVLSRYNKLAQIIYEIEE